MDLQQGSCIRLAAAALDPFVIEELSDPAASESCRGADQAPSEQLYQVIGVDQNGGRCWLRRWPLARHGSPVFEIALQQL